MNPRQKGMLLYQKPCAAEPADQKPWGAELRKTPWGTELRQKPWGAEQIFSGAIGAREFFLVYKTAMYGLVLILSIQKCNKN